VDAVEFGINIVDLISIVSGFMKSVCHLPPYRFRGFQSSVLETIPEEIVYIPEESNAATWLEKMFGCLMCW
jgi:hypothetical protein